MKKLIKMYMVIHMYEDGPIYEHYVSYMDSDLEKCKEFVKDMINDGEYSKGDWDIVTFDIDYDVVMQVLVDFFKDETEKDSD